MFLQASTFSAFKIWFHMESFESLTFCVSDAICERDHDSNSQVLVEIVCLVQFWWSVFMTPCLNYNAVAVLAIEGLQFGGSLLVYWVYWYSYNTFLLSLALREINTLSYRVYLCQALCWEKLGDKIALWATREYTKILWKEESGI